MSVSAASAIAQTESFPLWEKGAPDALGTEDQDVPTLTLFSPVEGTATGAAMVICPGGGYGHLAEHEGKGYAEYLTKFGITCFVLKYRLGNHGYKHPSMLNDAARAVRLVRHRAADWNVDPSRIGIMGSSAGGHLASSLLTHYDAGDLDAEDPVDHASSRPDLGVLCYAVISMGDKTHQGSKRNLLGDKPDPALVWLMSNELQVTPDTPPCFVWHTAEDTAVPVENSLMFAAALAQAKVPFDLHVFEKGRHGIGLGNRPPENLIHPWADDLVFWLRERGFVAAE